MSAQARFLRNLSSTGLLSASQRLNGEATLEAAIVGRRKGNARLPFELRSTSFFFAVPAIFRHAALGARRRAPRRARAEQRRQFVGTETLPSWGTIALASGR